MTIFEKIIAGDVACDKVFENENFIVIKDRFPQAAVHLLIIPKKHIERLQDMQNEDFSLLAEAGKIIQQLAEAFSISDGYRVVINNGVDGGQSVFHLHIHLLGGSPLGAIA
ncbi:histidine triad nucleotide-binding protein [Chlamydia gallinacea]|uniref:Histidine triad nucleotide-binding protein n=2 Tax=Chlamydia gallinacea TaxID=1457153 RepID=A0A173DZF8_9CHLA|nr:histidine triad nucleotide-binding protein [Chlamydia gallinacea]EYE61859.1 HIT domain protein [Bacteroides fragilis str. S6L5]ANG66314.1 histidine triad nucleotide-binding protein [Chlamydia gallinacea 08-1274/3]AQT77482.1 histidine triad nucleotide-binding protein [Chlamydia gallinacea]MBX6679789.1 histidine triad nucleotide-binding protein [Chlamydia gallinacea]MBX6687719.1 histidine triad nucleotide-binding protein [Chlamydia gallinacea]